MRPARSASRGKSIPRLDLPPPSSSSSPSTSFLSLLTIFFALSLLLSLSVSTVSAAVALADPSQSIHVEEKARPTKTTVQRSPTRTSTGTPSPTIPPQCADCWGVNNTSGMTCYHNTQCVPTALLCDDDNNPCTDVDGDQDPGDPILCQDQLCVGVYFLPVPSPGSGKLNRSTSDCWPGNYYSLFGDTPKYTQSCVQDYVSVPTSCSSWEYLAQSSCFLSTCKDDSYCETPFLCVRRNEGDAYGICSNNGTIPGTSDLPSGGGSAAQYSSKEYLVQGLLIGTCSLALGVGLGVGFWHYRNKRRRLRRWSDTTDNGDGSSASRVRGRTPSFSSAATGKEGNSFLRRLLFCRGPRKSRPATGPAVDQFAVNNEDQDSAVEAESREGSIVTEPRPSLLPAAGRWRWGIPGVNGPRSAPMVPEFEPPPMYHNGPRLPTYGDSTEDIALTSIQSRHGDDSYPNELAGHYDSRALESTAAMDHPRNNGGSQGQDRTSTSDVSQDPTLGETEEATLRGGPPPLMAVEGRRQPTPTPPTAPSSPLSVSSPRPPSSPKDMSPKQRHSTSKDRAE